MCAFEGWIVDTVITAMEANHLDLTIQKTLEVEIDRIRKLAEFVTDDVGTRSGKRLWPARE